MRRFIRLSLLLIVAAAVAGPLLPAPTTAASPLTINCADPVVGAEVTSPGSYVLTSAVLGCGSDIAIEIDASNVTLDLKGLLVDGDDTGSIGIGVTATRRNVVVRNGVVADFKKGVAVEGTRTTVTRMTLRSTADYGIHLTGERNTVTRNAVVDGALGIVSGTNDSIVGNTISRVGSGVVTDGEGAQVVRNKVTEVSSTGINIGGARTRVAGNAVHGAAGAGIGVFAANSVVSGNRVEGGNRGIEVSVASTIVDNAVTGVSDSGIRLTGTGSSVRGNVVTGSGVDGIAVLAADSLVTRNVVKAGGVAGIRTGAVTGATITRNHVTGNDFSGIVVHDDATNHVDGNVANGNGAQGIDAGPLVTGHNTAKFNASTDQCDPEDLCN